VDNRVGGQLLSLVHYTYSLENIRTSYMDPTFNSSFIPKRSLSGAPGKGAERYTRRRSIYGPGFFLASLVFALALVSAIGVFAYIQYTQKTIEQKLVKIDQAQEILEPETVQRWKRNAARLSIAKKIVQEHPSVTGFLQALEENTLENVQYTSLAYGNGGRSRSRGSSKQEEEKSFSIEAVTVDLRHVAAQVDQFHSVTDKETGEQLLLGVTVPEVSRERAEAAEDQTVRMSVQGVVSDRLLSFARAMDIGAYDARGASVSDLGGQIVPVDGGTAVQMGDGVVGGEEASVGDL